MKRVLFRYYSAKVEMNVELKSVKVDDHSFYGTDVIETYRVWNDDLGVEYEVERESRQMGYEYDEHCYGDEAFDEDGELIISEEEQRELEKEYDEMMEDEFFEQISVAFEELDENKSEVVDWFKDKYGYEISDWKWWIDEFEEGWDLETGVGVDKTDDEFEQEVDDYTYNGKHVMYIGDVTNKVVKDEDVMLYSDMDDEDEDEDEDLVVLDKVEDKELICTKEGSHYNGEVERNIYEKISLWKIGDHIYVEVHTLGGMEISGGTGVKICTVKGWDRIVDERSLDGVVERIFCRGAENLVDGCWKMSDLA